MHAESEAQMILSLLRFLYWCLILLGFAYGLWLAVSRKNIMYFVFASTICLFAYILPLVSFCCICGSMPINANQYRLIRNSHSSGQIVRLLGNPHVVEPRRKGFKYTYFSDEFYIEWVVIHFDDNSKIDIINRGR
jgi:hypothetical protein